MAVLNDAYIEHLLDIDYYNDLSDNRSILRDHLTETEYENSGDDEKVNNDNGDVSSLDTQQEPLGFIIVKIDARWAIDTPVRSHTQRRTRRCVK